MSDTCKTVRVVSKEHAIYGGFKEINESDLTAEHVLWVEAALESVSPAQDEFSDMTAADARAYLAALSISVSKNTTVEALRQKCRDAMKG